jgi:bifunctional non-homologous end joining protein LigD
MSDSSLDVEPVLAQLENSKESLSLELGNVNLPVTNLNKIFWPATADAQSLTKRDYMIYLTRVSPFVIPHLRDRLITLVRFPNGINEGRFYQKHWNKGLPGFVETRRIFTEQENKDKDFLVCNNLPTLLWLGQIADLELHTSHTRTDPKPDAEQLPLTFTGSVERLEQSLMNYPDFLVLDLDPYLYSGEEKIGEEPELHQQGFRNCCAVALHLKGLLDKINVGSFIKTSGKTGLHIYVPIIRSIDYATVRALSEIICRQILKDHPDEVTMDWLIVNRTGKVFMDHNMNARSKSLASIYSPRVHPLACVSTPLSWDELGSVFPSDFTMRSLPQRLATRGDLWCDILHHKRDLNFLLEGGAETSMNPVFSEFAEQVKDRKQRGSKRSSSKLKGEKKWP